MRDFLAYYSPRYVFSPTSPTTTLTSLQESSGLTNAKFNQEFDSSLTITLPHLEEGRDLQVEVISSSQAGPTGRMIRGDKEFGVKFARGDAVKPEKRPTTLLECEELCECTAECMFWNYDIEGLCNLKIVSEAIAYTPLISDSGSPGRGTNKITINTL